MAHALESNAFGSAGWTHGDKTSLVQILGGDDQIRETRMVLVGGSFPPEEFAGHSWPYSLVPIYGHASVLKPYLTSIG
jgi:hypothetical protein